MDPEACIARIESLTLVFEGTSVDIEQGGAYADTVNDEAWCDARDDVFEAIGDYRQWRRSGGFEPPNGDARVKDFTRRVNNPKNVKLIASD